ncbi:MAG TPA: ATP-binding protein, partial [Pyrinomonadaceae bacterium]|nr:ATP-binding protein [Pyrinomonadaceae bacterium]
LGLVRVPKGLDEIAGACARSHGMGLRESVEVIPRLNRREYLKVHAPFLMSVLRVADYIQIHSERAPEQILKVRALKSPVSQGEWTAHDAVEDIHCTHDDPEAIVVVAKPKDVRTFLKLERLLTWLQKELDASWAVLGEVYGRLRGLSELGLTIRRVRSNLDDKDAFARTVPYHPERIIFEADPEILKLLIDPLYGNRPNIGIRELVQNAVDACLELNDYAGKVSPGRRAKASSTEASVLVRLEEDAGGDGGWLTVSDNGIGMTPEVIKNYFLKAGASFRRSEAWKRMHESAPGKSRVLRSGRFGIGLLAAFLLGNRLEVETRHVTSPPDDGVRFSCSIEDEEIELQRCTLPEVGTTIRVRISAGVFGKLNTPGSYYSGEGRSSWDWYHLKTPAVKREVITQRSGVIKTETLKPDYLLPNAHARLPPDWRRIRHEDFEDIHWSYTGEMGSENNLFCNGIKVGRWDNTDFEAERKFEWPFSLEEPVLSVFDPDGKLPLNLERSDMARILPFERKLVADICRDIIAYLLVHTPGRPLLDAETAKAYGEISYPGIQSYFRYNRRNEWFWSTPNGLSLATSRFLHSISPRNLYILPRLEALQADIPEEYANVYCSSVDWTLGSFDPWIRFVSAGIAPTSFGYRVHNYAGWLSHVKTSGRRILLSTEY